MIVSNDTRLISFAPHKLRDLKEADEEEGGEDQMQEVDETELGDDPFARGGEGVSLDAGNEPWLKSDRDYTYEEVLSLSRCARL